MIIKEKDFELKLNEANYKFDLSLLHTVNAKKENSREELKLIGYGMSLENCFRYIINNRISKNIETASLKEYIELYKQEKDKLSETLSKELNGADLHKR